MTVLIAALGTFLVVPRPTRPRVVPLPTLDQKAMEEREATERQRASRVRDGSLPTRVRIIGELVRRVGLASTKDAASARKLIRELRTDTKRFLDKRGPEELLDLRALQTQLFVEEVRHFVTREKASTHLLELGGDFADVAEKSWLTEGHLLLTEPQLRLLYRIRWGRLTGTHRVAPFGPSLGELRRYYTAYLENPEGGLVGDARTIAFTRLGYARALAEVDPEYPGELALGILELRAERRERARKLLTNRLRGRPDGEWFLSTRNFLALASHPHPF